MKHACSFSYPIALCIALFAAASAIDARAQTAHGNVPTTLQPVAASDALAATGTKGTQGTQDTAKAAKSANRALRKVVMRQLSRTRGLDVDGINVTAANGVVTLLGTVPDTGQIDLAADVARDVAGVRAVRNGLTLQTNGK